MRIGRADDKDPEEIQRNWDSGYGDGTAAWEYTRTSDDHSCWFCYHSLAGYDQCIWKMGRALNEIVILVAGAIFRLMLRNNGVYIV